MILRRIIEHVKAQNWTAIVLDFVIVVVGVFIGIQVSNWNGARADRELARDYLQRIHEDLRGDLDRYDLGDQLANSRVLQIALLYRGIADPESVKEAPRQFVEAVEKAAWRSYEPVEPGAYAELVDTGKVALIAPVALRDEIAQYYRQIERWERIVVDRQAQLAFTQATAGLLDRRLLDIVEIGEGAVADSGEAVSGDEAVDIAQRLAASPEAMRWLPQLHHHQMVVKSIDERHRERARALIEMIETHYPGIGEEMMREPEPALVHFTGPPIDER